MSARYDLSNFYFLSDEEYDSQDESNNEVNTEYGVDGYMYVEYGDIFVNRYFSIRKLGWGHFSTVWLCWDIFEERFIALKILKSKPNYMNLAFDEIKLLKILTKTDSLHSGYNHTIRFYDFFKLSSFNGTHMCMVFEVSGCNLLSFIKDFTFKHDGVIVPINLLKKLSIHLLQGLVYIHDVCGIIHTDIKPENIVISMNPTDILIMAQKSFFLNLKQQLPIKYISNITNKLMKEHKKWQKRHKSSNLKEKKTVTENFPFILNETEILNIDTIKAQILNNETSSNGISNYDYSKNNREKWHSNLFKFCDFGNACYIDKHFSEHIQTCEYQSPEVIVEASYNETADIWSLACTIFELATGEYLFDPHSGKNYTREEDHLSQIIEIVGDVSIQHLKKGKKYKNYFNSRGTLRHISQPSQWKLSDVLIEKYEWNHHDAELFEEFLMPMLNIDPNKRSSASECLKHPWLNS